MRAEVVALSNDFALTSLIDLSYWLFASKVYQCLAISVSRILELVSRSTQCDRILRASLVLLLASRTGKS